MFKKLLIANRGEIALRIIRTCRELGIQTVVAHSEADRDSLPVMLADESICIGPARAQDSYLNVSRVLSAAEVTGCEAVHPGYGFLSEDPEFAEATGDCKLVFVGPSPQTLRLLGDKIAARRTISEAGVPVVPGSEAEVRDAKEAIRIAKTIEFPIIIKAAAGGGGKGMRIIRREKDLESGFRMCQAEAKASFGDDRVYIEKYLPASRHIEVQVLADHHGHALTLGERDCSCQRRHQKLIEESPAPTLDARVRRKLSEWALAAVKTSNYTNAGTVEFICDSEGNCYFMEMNARLQVEHPVTEMVFGIDIVREQLRIAAGESLSDAAVPGSPSGCAIECRIYAEDPDADFEPSPGIITELILPGGPGIRVDAALLPGQQVSANYDPLIAKIIAWAPNRTQAIARMDRALFETTIAGIATTTTFCRRVMNSGRFRRSQILTSTLDEEP